MDTTNLSVTEAIEALLKLQDELKNIPQPLKLPEQKKAYTTSEWNAYAEQLKRVEAENNKNKYQVEYLESEIRILTRDILAIIPAAHIWFISDDQKYAYAKQCSNWPNDPAHLKFVPNPDIESLPELRMEIVSIN
jgi:primase-polymerase (primpol)-like protein